MRHSVDEENPDHDSENESNPETAAPKGVWAAMHGTNDNSECAPRSHLPCSFCGSLLCVRAQ